MKLMCKDTEIYDIDSNTILNKQLVPRQFKDIIDFEKWLNSRRFTVTNEIAKDVMYRVSPNLIAYKRSLSLSDCYWVKENYDICTFNEITPYENDFMIKHKDIRKQSIPLKTLGGSFTKEWAISKDGKRVIRKYGTAKQLTVEYDAWLLSCDFKIPCNEVTLYDNYVEIENISNLDWMLITYSQLGKKVNGGSPVEILSVYVNPLDSIGAVLDLELFDAVIGNNDRQSNMGNLAVLKNTITGELKFPPMFDFNLAHNWQLNMYLMNTAILLHKDNLADNAIQTLIKWGTIPNRFWEENRKILIQNLSILLDRSNGN